jgi:hypothetical protein
MATRRTTSTDYERSNSIETIEKKRFKKSLFSKLLEAKEDEGSRQKAAQALVDDLCKQYKINSPKVYVTERPRRSSGGGQTYGYYRHGGGVKDSIVIYNTTAKTGKKVSIKSFADTLLHEFVHHYDTRYLKIETMHTAGFYKRISSLKESLSNVTIATKNMLRDVTERRISSLVGKSSLIVG